MWIENERLHAEWVNVPAQLAERGAYIRSECRHVGALWIGTTQSYLPCETTENGKRVSNWCQVMTKAEFNHVGANRVTGRSERLKRFDCQRCRVLETDWQDFEWVPKEQSAVDSKQ